LFELASPRNAQGLLNGTQGSSRIISVTYECYFGWFGAPKFIAGGGGAPYN